MVRIRVDLDQETYEALVDASLIERRPIPWQAEVALRRALGLPFPSSPLDEQSPRELVAAAADEPDRAA